jgi:hypothetical protein
MADGNITTWTTIRQKMDETGLYSISDDLDLKFTV